MHYTLCDLFADLTQNSVEAQAKKITVEVTETQTDITVSIKDDGKGMSQETLHKAVDPFYTDGVKHPKRKVGLGLPFLVQTANDTNGEWKIDSEPGKGTSLYCRFDTTNIDTPPVGDVALFFRQILTFSGSYEMEIIRSKPGCSYKIVRSELIDALGNLETAGSLALLGDFLLSQESEE